MHKGRPVEREPYVSDLVKYSNQIWTEFRKQGLKGEKNYKAFDPIVDPLKGRESHFYLDYYANVCKNQLCMGINIDKELYFKIALSDTIRAWRLFRPFLDKILDFTVVDEDFGVLAEELSVIRDAHVFKTDKRGNPIEKDDNFQFTHNYTMGIAYELDRVHRKLNGIEDVIFGNPKEKGGGVRCILRRSDPQPLNMI